MAPLTALRPKPQITDTSHPWLSWLSGSSLDSTVVANAIAGTGWSVHYHEAPDYEASLMVLPDEDDRCSTFVVSASGAGLCLHECRDDAFHRLGLFNTMEDMITSLRRAIADQAGAEIIRVAGQA